MKKLLFGILGCVLATAAQAEPVTIPLDGSTLTFDSSLLPPVDPGCQVLQGENDPLPEVGNNCDAYISASGFLWWPKADGAWPETAINLNPPPPTRLPATMLEHLQVLGAPTINVIQCNGEIAAAVQASLDAGKWTAIDWSEGGCTTSKTVSWDQKRARLFGMGVGGNNSTATKITFKGSGCMFEMRNGQSDTSGGFIGGFSLTDAGTGDPTKRHGICMDGMSNNTMIEWVNFTGFHDQIHLEGALSDNSAAFRGTIKNIFAFRARGCVVRVTKNPDTNKWPLVELSIMEIDIGRANEAAVCLDDISTVATTVTISGGVIDSGNTPNGIAMPDGVKIRRGFPTSGAFAAITVIGVDSWAADLVDSDIPAHVALVGNNLYGNAANPTPCSLAINLPGTANDVTCAAAHGQTISR